MFSEPKDATPGKTAGPPAVRMALSLVYFLAGSWHLLMTVRPLLRAMFGYHTMEFLPDVWGVRGYVGLTGALLLLLAWWLFPGSGSSAAEAAQGGPEVACVFPLVPAVGTIAVSPLLRFLLSVLSLALAVFAIAQLTGHGPLASSTSGTLGDGMNGVDLGGLLTLACAWCLFPRKKRLRIAGAPAARAEAGASLWVRPLMQVLCIALLGAGFIQFEKCREEWASQSFSRSRRGGDYDVESMAGPAFAGSVCMGLVWILLPWRKRYSASPPAPGPGDESVSTPSPPALAMQSVLLALSWASLAAGVWQFARLLIPILTENHWDGWSLRNVNLCTEGVVLSGLAGLLFYVGKCRK